MSTSTKSASPAQRIGRIGRTKAAQMINDSKGKFFTAIFTTPKGERKITCRKNVSKYVKGTGKNSDNTETLGYVRVYDMINKGYRFINLQTLSYLKMTGQEWKVA